MFSIKHFYEDPGTIAVIALGISAVSTAVSIDQQRSAARSSKKARKAQERIQAIKTARERRQQVRQSIVARAQAEAQGQATGTSRSSSISQAKDSVQSQLAGNISFLDNVTALNKQTSIFQQQAADATSRAGVASAISGIALSGGSLFGSPTPTKSNTPAPTKPKTPAGPK